MTSVLGEEKRKKISLVAIADWQSLSSTFVIALILPLRKKKKKTEEGDNRLIDEPIDEQT